MPAGFFMYAANGFQPRALPASPPAQAARKRHFGNPFRNMPDLRGSPGHVLMPAFTRQGTGAADVR